MASAAAAAAIRNIIQIESVGEAKGIKLFIKLNHKRSQNGGDPLYTGMCSIIKIKVCPLLLSHTSCAVLLGFFNNITTQIWACNLYTSQQRFRAINGLYMAVV
jgi:hypothetical protein